MERPVVITLCRDDLKYLNYDSSKLWEWCQKHKIKAQQPMDEKTKRYLTIVITLNTPEQKFLFAQTFLKILEKLENPKRKEDEGNNHQ